MFKSILTISSIFYALSAATLSFATPVIVKDDQISDLIKKVEYRSQQDEKQITKIENQMLDRASWNIKCKYKVFDDTKVCLMQKGDLSVLHLNNQFIVNIGEKVLKNSMVSVKIDNHKIFQDREGLFRNANTMIEQFKRGNFVFARYVTSTKNQEIERKISLAGFTEAFNDMESQFLSLNNEKKMKNL